MLYPIGPNGPVNQGDANFHKRYGFFSRFPKASPQIINGRPLRKFNLNTNYCVLVILEAMNNVKSFTFLGCGHFSLQKEFS